MGIDLIIKWLVKLIMGSIEKLMYNAKKQEATEKVNEAKEVMNEAKQDSDTATSDFKLKLEQYRKQQSTNLRRTIDRMHASSGETGKDDKGTGQGNSGSNRSH